MIFSTNSRLGFDISFSRSHSLAMLFLMPPYRILCHTHIVVSYGLHSFHLPFPFCCHRLDVKKVVTEQSSLENKELAVVAVSFSIACVAVLKLVSDRVLTLFGAAQSGEVGRKSRGWVLILVSSSMMIFITFLCS